MLELQNDQELFSVLPGSPEAVMAMINTLQGIDLSYERECEKSYPDAIEYVRDDEGLDAAPEQKRGFEREQTKQFHHMEQWLQEYLKEKRPIVRFPEPRQEINFVRPNGEKLKYVLDFFEEMERGSCISKQFSKMDSRYKQAESVSLDTSGDLRGIVVSGVITLVFAALALLCFWLNGQVGLPLRLLTTLGIPALGLLAVFCGMTCFHCFSAYREHEEEIQKRPSLYAAFYKAVETDLPPIHRYVRFCELWCEAEGRTPPKTLQRLRSRVDNLAKAYKRT